MFWFAPLRVVLDVYHDPCKYFWNMIFKMNLMNRSENADHDFNPCVHSMEALDDSMLWFLFSDVALSCQIKFSNQVTNWQAMSKSKKNGPLSTE